MRGRSPTERGEDLRYTLEIDFEDAAIGCERQIRVPRRSQCPSCGGTGARAGTAPIICQACNGRGTLQSDQAFFRVNEPCPQCEGTGRRIPQACTECRGRGTARVQHPVTVTVPAGVESGTRLRLAGEGETGAGGGPRGDLYVIVQIKPHPFFKREDQDVVTEVPVRFVEAALGATVEVPTLDGKIRMRIPPGSQPGRVFRLKGRGVPQLKGGGRGDQRVKIQVEVPVYMTPEQRKLLERYLSAEEAHDQNPIVRDFNKKLDEYYGEAEGAEE